MARLRESGSATKAGHPVVGLWAWDDASARHPGARSYTVFHADGTFVDTHSLLGTGVGAWRATGERTLDLFIVYHDRDPGGTPRGVVTANGVVELVGTGDALIFACAYEVKALDGSVEKAGTQTETATRITVEGMQMGMSNAGTPTP